MAISKMLIETGRLRCNISEDTCPEAFHFLAEGSPVRSGADPAPFDAKIRPGADLCPVHVIKFVER